MSDKWTSYLNKSDISLSNFYRGSSIAWVIALVYLFYNPVIIYGRNYLLNQLSIRTKLYDPWSYKSLNKIDSRELGLYKKLKTIIPELIHKTKILEQDFSRKRFFFSHIILISE